MSENRYYACPSGNITFKGQGWHVIDRHTGKDAESLRVGGYSEERARQLAKLLNLSVQPSNVPAFEGNRWNVSGPELIVYVECDRPRDRAPPGIVGRVRVNGHDFECLVSWLAPSPASPCGSANRSAWWCANWTLDDRSSHGRAPGGVWRHRQIYRREQPSSCTALIARTNDVPSTEDS
jgi:hypothetical protein